MYTNKKIRRKAEEISGLYRLSYILILGTVALLVASSFLRMKNLQKTQVTEDTLEIDIVNLPESSYPVKIVSQTVKESKAYYIISIAGYKISIDSETYNRFIGDATEITTDIHAISYKNTDLYNVVTEPSQKEDVLTYSEFSIFGGRIYSSEELEELASESEENQDEQDIEESESTAVLNYADNIVEDSYFAMARQQEMKEYALTMLTQIKYQNLGEQFDITLAPGWAYNLRNY